MYKFKYNLLMIFLLLFSLLMVINSNSLYFMWIFMELNVMMFLTFLVVNSNFVSVISMKYYLMSSLSSIIFMFFINLYLFNEEINFVLIILNMMMFMKLGVVPFHFWFIDMMINMNWLMCFILSTVQKIIPFLILSYLFNMKFIYIFSLIGGVIGLMLSFNQNLIKKILAYSSINHMFWMLMSLLLKFNFWLIYFLNYMLINGSLFYMFHKLNVIQISELYQLFMYSKLNLMFYLTIMFFSLGGLPPFYGFLLKWFMIINMMSWSMNFVLIFLIIYSLIFLYFYMRMLYNNMLLNFWSVKFNYKFNNLIGLNWNFIYMLIFLSSLNLLMFLFWFIY